MQITAFSAEFLQVALCYQTLNISLTNVELRVFREIYGTAPCNQMKEIARVGFTKLTHTPSGFHPHPSRPERQ
jgi:hypothetical protein